MSKTWGSLGLSATFVVISLKCFLGILDRWWAILSTVPFVSWLHHPVARMAGKVWSLLDFVFPVEWPSQHMVLEVYNACLRRQSVIHLPALCGLSDSGWCHLMHWCPCTAKASTESWSLGEGPEQASHSVSYTVMSSQGPAERILKAAPCHTQNTLMLKYKCVPRSSSILNSLKGVEAIGFSLI